jgi:hypothetical protein
MMRAPQSSRTPTRRLRFPAATVAALSCVLPLVGCVSSGDSDEVRSASSDSALAFETLRDWISFGDLVLAVTVIDERTLPKTDPAGTYLPREITVEIDATLWSAVDPPASPFDLPVLGYHQEGAKEPVALADGVRMEVGSSYVVALADYPGEGLGLFSPDSVIPVDGDVVMASEARAAGASALDHLTLSEVAARLAQTRPYPGADRVAYPDPVERQAVVYEARSATADATSAGT